MRAQGPYGPAAPGDTVRSGAGPPGYLGSPGARRPRLLARGAALAYYWIWGPRRSGAAPKPRPRSPGSIFRPGSWVRLPPSRARAPPERAGRSPLLDRGGAHWGPAGHLRPSGSPPSAARWWVHCAAPTRYWQPPPPRAHVAGAAGAALTLSIGRALRPHMAPKNIDARPPRRPVRRHGSLPLPRPHHTGPSSPGAAPPGAPWAPPPPHTARPREPYGGRARRLPAGRVFRAALRPLTSFVFIRTFASASLSRGRCFYFCPPPTLD